MSTHGQSHEQPKCFALSQDMLIENRTAEMWVVVAMSFLLSFGKKEQLCNAGVCQDDLPVTCEVVRQLSRAGQGGEAQKIASALKFCEDH